MDSLSHFIFSVLAGMAVGLHKKHKLRYVLFISFLAVLIDLDHFLVPLGYQTEYRSMHNVYYAILAPVILFFVSYYYERNAKKDRFQTFFLLLGIMLTGHLIADMIEGPVKIFYPLSEIEISLPYVNIQSTKDFQSTIVGQYGIGLAAYAFIIFSGAMIHDTLWHARRDKTGLMEAFRKSVTDYF
jgi:membrane-bound metal-dependent hydrolase YbcI (DUF457 family)